jgi:hypothetical protein
MSNLVFSVKLSLGDAIAAASKYKSKFKASELENNFQVDVEGISVRMVVTWPGLLLFLLQVEL